MIVEKGDFHFAEKYFWGGIKAPLPPISLPVPKALNNMKSQIKKKSNGGIVELLLLRGQKLFWVKNYEQVVLNWRTNGQIMPRFGRSFIINDKCIFQ